MHAAQLKSSPAPEPRPVDATALTRLWLAATATWAHRWTSACGDLPIDDHGHLTAAGSLWARGLAGFDERQMLDALASFVAAGAEWPPMLPEMRVRCFGLPTFETVNHELLTKTTPDRSAFARMVWGYIADPHNYRIAPAREQERTRKAAYDLACEAVMRGEPLPGPIAGVIEQQQSDLIPKGIPATPEARKANLARLLGEEFNPVAADRSLEELQSREARRERKRVSAPELQP
jgi:hypothetical protein